MSDTAHGRQTAVFLLKNPSEPVDRYQQVLEAAKEGSFTPVFVPVLEHRLLDAGIDQITQLFIYGQFSSQSPERRFDGIIFTSQRAVAAFAVVLDRIKAQTGKVASAALLDDTSSFYVVGQATCTALAELKCPCPIKGQETGNGAALAQFILDQYTDGKACRRLLFMVGETRRDIIPKTLGSTSLPEEKRIQVDEIEVYQSAENLDFAQIFASQIAKFEDMPLYVAVFSPMGCQSMLRVLGLLNSDSKQSNGSSPSKVKVVTIGPTTRDYLVDNFSFSPQAVAEKPTPEGLLKAIVDAI